MREIAEQGYSQVKSCRARQLSEMERGFWSLERFADCQVRMQEETHPLSGPNVEKI
ncbi:hypothetical protein L208DRAFT_1390047 [Tricholoma matsutake]|nr:hypothetical protein L208DRAFT_1390047 [Tricholoma matsutake 945]